MRYRRNYVSGGTYFLTIVLENRNRQLLLEKIDILKAAFNYVKQRHPFTLEAYVVLPDHLHILISLPEDDTDYSLRVKLIKSYFSRHVNRIDLLTKSKQSKGEREIWQRRFWEHTIRNERDYAYHVYYIHYNPVKHKYVLNPIDWEHSSIHHFVKVGKASPDWSSSIIKP